MISRKKSEELFGEALKYIPGGVNSPVRAFRAVGGQPFFVNKAKGAHVWDVDGNDYVDYVGTWGPAILGHDCHAVSRRTAIDRTADRCQGRRIRSRRGEPSVRPRCLDRALRSRPEGDC